MTPSTWVSFLFFLYFLLPGLFLDYRSRRYVPSVKESAIRELSRVVLGSITFTTLGFSILLLVHFIDIHRFVDLRAYFDHPDSYPRNNFRLVFWNMIAELAIAFTGVWLFDNFRQAILSPNLTGTHQWDVLFRNRRVAAALPRRWVVWTVRRFSEGLRDENIVTRGGKKIKIATRPVALVTLNSKEQFVGYVDLYSVEESPSEREILLSFVEGGYRDYLPKRFGDIARVNPDWKRMYIPANSIESIAVTYFEIPEN